MRVWWLVWFVALPLRDAASCFIVWLLAFAVLPVRDASACTIIGDREFVPGPREESVLPSPVTIGAVDIAVYDPEAGCGSGGTSCGGSVNIYVSVAATDDTTAADHLGYRVRVAGGPRRPQSSIGLEIGRDRLLASPGLVSLHLSLEDSELDFDLGVSAIDQSGNVGPETIVRIVHSDGRGCSSGRNGRPFGLLLALGTLALLLRRRC